MLAEVRTQLGLAPVLEAERALLARPDDRGARQRLADACAASGDPVGEALALYPLAEAAPLAVRFTAACIRVGWLDEAAAALKRLPSPPAGAWLELAAAYAGRGEAKAAVERLASLEKESLTPEQWIEGAITWYHCRRMTRAAQWARNGAAASNDPAARAVLARCLLALGEPEMALWALNPVSPSSAAASDPGHDPRLAFLQGRAEARSRDASLRATGRERLARLALSTPNPAAAFEAGRGFLLAGDARRAVPLLSQAAVGGYQEVLCYELLARAYTHLGSASEADWARGRALLLRGRYAGATRALERAVARGSAKSMAFVDLARALHASGKLREALKVLERARNTDPRNLDARLMAAKLLLHLERADEVVRWLTEAAELDPARANEPLGNLGTVYFDSQQYDRAVPVLEKAVAVEDGDAHSHFYLGRTHARHPEEPERAQKAVRHLLRAAKLQPDYSRPWMAAASVLQRMGFPSEAAACLRRAIAGDPRSDAPYVPLGQILQAQGRTSERQWLLRLYAATRDHDLKRTGLEKETREHPDDAARRFALGDLLLREGRPEKALPELLAAAGMRPDWKKAQTRLADACALLGFDDLREEAEAALRSPDAPS